MNIQLRSRAILWGLFLMLGTAPLIKPASAVPACPDADTLLQPDGTPVRLFLRGDEHLHWNEDAAGYTVLKESSGGRWVYAVTNAAGELVGSSRAVGQADPAALGVPRRLLPAGAVAAAGSASAARRTALLTTGLPVRKAPLTGTMKNLVLLVAFSDKAFTYTTNQFDALFNTIGYTTDGAQGSVKDYYKEVSYNQLTVDSVVVAPVTLANGYAYYGGNDAYGNDLRPREMVQQALAALEARGFDFSMLDNDGDGWVDGLTVIHAGGGEEYSGNDENYIWSHQWDLSSAITYDGKKLQTYHTEPERRGWDSSSSTWGVTRIGVICHENGHFLGLPDLYDYGYDSQGVGEFCLMAGGSWNGDNGTQPAHMSAYCKASLAWVNATTVTAAGTYTVPRVEDNRSLFRLSGNFPSTQYFLVENRQGQGFDASLPGTSRGLLIWHVDETQPDNNDQTHYMVDLEEASGTQHLQSTNTAGNDADYFRVGTMTTFTSNTTPNNLSYAGAALGMDITAVSATASSMTFTVSMNTPVTITGNPQSRTNDPGSAAGFTVTATGTPPLYYQWQKNTTNISLATNSTYTIGAVTTNDAGSYRCRVSNVVNAATSAVAVLTVNSAPVFNPLGVQTAVVGVAKTVTVSAAGTPAPVLALQSATASSGYSFTVGTGVLVYTPPVADGGSTRTFTFTASNSLGVATQAVSVLVNEAPPAAPAAIWAAATNTTDFTAAWSAVSGTTGYRLDVATNSSFSGGGGSGATLLDENFDAWTGAWINGWSHNSGVQYTTGGVGNTPCVGMNAANDWIQAPVCTNVGTLSFYVRTSSDPGNWTVVVRTSPDGTNWTDRATIVEDGTGGTINNTPLQTNMVLNLSGLCHVRWAMTARSADSVYIDNVLITGQDAGTPSYVPGYSNLTVAGTSQNVTGLVTGATYYFRARAVSGGGTGTNSAVTSVTTVAKASQTIDFPAIGAQMATQVLALSATASSGLPVAFSVASGPAAITNGSTMSFTGAGTVAVVASQAGNAGWNPAPNVTNTFSVTKASATMTLGGLAQTYNGTARAINATTVPAGLAVDITYDGAATAPTNAGSYAVTGTVSDARYQGVAADMLVVAKAAAAVTLEGLAQTYDGSPKVVTAATVPAGLAVDFTYAGSPAAPVAAGSYAVTGTVNDLNYAGSANSTLSVAKAGQTITFPAIDAQVATATVALAATASGGLPVEYSVASGPAVISGGSNLTFTGAGTVSIAAAQPGDANWNPAPNVTNTFAVAKAAAAVTLENLVQAYDGAPKSVTAVTVPPGLAVVITYAGSPAAPVAAGSYAVTGTIDDVLYQGSASGTLNITNPPTPFEQWLLDRTLDPEDPRYDPAADDDHDGATTEEEYLADTDPALAGSVFVITGAYDIATVPGGTGQIRLAFPASTARYYQLEYCIDLTNHIIGTRNLGWGVPGMVVTDSAPGTWYGVIRSRLQEPGP